MLSLFSCTKVIYTHEQVLNRYQTKQEVINRFGMPTEKRKGEGGIEEWLYKFEKHDSFTNHSVNAVNNTQTADVTEFNSYKRCIIFTLDDHGNVLSWKFEKVDLAERKPAPGKTIALVLGSIVLVVALYGAAVLATNGVFSGGY
jgi:hypothetical protein